MQVRQVLRGAFAAAIAMVFFTASAEGGKWYVDAGKPAGSGDGLTPETAFHTIQDAVTNASVQAGDTVYVAEGFYNEGWNKTKTHSYNGKSAYHNARVYLTKRLNLIASGEKSKTVICGEVGTADASMRDPTGADLIAFATNDVSCIVVGVGAEGSLVRGFTLRDGWANHMAHGALAAGGVCHYNPSEADTFTVIDCDFDHCFGRGGGAVIGGTVIRCSFTRSRASDGNRGIVALSRVYNCISYRNNLEVAGSFTDFFDCIVVNSIVFGNRGRYGLYKSDTCPDGFGVAYNTLCYGSYQTTGYTGGAIRCVLDGSYGADSSEHVTALSRTDLAEIASVCVCPFFDDFRPVKGGLLDGKGDKNLLDGFDFIPAEERSLDFNGNPFDATAGWPIGLVLPAAEVKSSIYALAGDNTRTNIMVNGRVVQDHRDNNSAMIISKGFIQSTEWPCELKVEPVNGERFLGLSTPYLFPAGQYDYVFLGLPTNGTAAGTITLQEWTNEIFVDDDATFEGNPDGTAEKPFRSIQAAIDSISDNSVWTVIRVAEGTYEYDEDVCKTDDTGCKVVVYAKGRKVVVKATGAREKTIIRGAADTTVAADHGCGANAVRCAYLSGNGVLSGLTLTEGHAQSISFGDTGSKHLGGAVWCGSTDSHLVDCLFTANAGTTAVGVNGIYTRCVFTGNTYYSRGVVHSCTCSGCLFYDNASKDYGGSYALFYNSVVAYQCTLSEPNASGCNIYNVNCTLINCIVNGYGYTRNGTRVAGTLVRNTMVGGDLLTEEPNAHGNPRFVSMATGDFRLCSGSPAIGLGIAADPEGKVTTDNIVRFARTTVDNKPVVQADGSINAGAYADVLPIVKVGIFVSPTGDDADTGVDADHPLRTLQVAVDRAVAEGEDVVHALPGTYAEGGRCHVGKAFEGGAGTTILLKSRVVVASGITLKADDPDPTKTIIRGAPSANPQEGSGDYAYGDDAYRCVFVENGAKVVGFTLTGGHTTYSKGTSSANYFDDCGGGGAYGRSIDGASVEDCIITGNYARNGGAGCNITFRRCKVYGNHAQYWGSFFRSGAAYDCYVRDNDGCSYVCDLVEAVQGCTFGPNYQDDGTTAARCFLNGSASWIVNTVVYGNTLSYDDAAPRRFRNCVFPKEKTIFATNAVVENVNVDFTSAELAAMFTDGMPKDTTNPVVDRGSMDGIGELDVNRTARVKNGTVDIGAFEYDWRGDYAKAIGRRVTVTEASSSVVMTDGHPLMRDGDALAATIAARSSATEGTYVIQAAITGSGKMLVYLNGTLLGELTASGELRFTNGLPSNDLRFEYKGEGSAYVAKVAQELGVLLIVR